MYINNMNKQKSARLFPGLGTKSALPTLLTLASITTITILTATFALNLNYIARNWQNSLNTQYTLEIPSANTATTPLTFGQGDTSTPDEYEREVINFLNNSPDIASITPIPETEVQKLLNPWLGTNTHEFLLPKIYELTLAANTTELPPQLTSQLAQLAPDTRLEQYDAWNEPMLQTANTLKLFSLAALAAAAVAFILVAASLSRAIITGHAEMVRLLHHLGATDKFLARKIAAGALRLGTVGAAAGTLVAAPLLLSAKSLEGPLAELVTTNTLWLLAAAPPAGGALAAAVSAASARLLLWRMP